MNRTEFAEVCKRTSRGLNSKEERLCNFALGLVGECSEVNEIINHIPIVYYDQMTRKAKLCAEFGDVFWYMFRLLSVIGNDYDDFLGWHANVSIEYSEFYCNKTKQIDIGAMSDKVLTLAGLIADDIKKHVFQGKDLITTSIEKKLAHIYRYSEYMLSCFGMTVEYVFEENVKKLKTRYPNGFTAEDAITKKDERANLSSTTDPI